MLGRLSNDCRELGEFIDRRSAKSGNDGKGSVEGDSWNPLAGARVSSELVEGVSHFEVVRVCEDEPGDCIGFNFERLSVVRFKLG